MAEDTQELKLNREECLELELINTKKAMLQQQAQSQAALLDGSLEKLTKQIDDRLGIKSKEYQVDLATGSLKKVPLQGLPQGQDPGAAGQPPDQQAVPAQQAQSSQNN